MKNHHFLKQATVTCLCLVTSLVLSAPRTTCTRPHLGKKTPANLTTIAPGSDFSFVVFDVGSANKITVSVKQKPVPIQTEYIAPIFMVKGKIPDEYHDTAVRITVKINSPHEACRLEEGWLVNVSK